MFVVAFLQFDSAWQAALVSLTAMVIGVDDLKPLGELLGE